MKVDWDAWCARSLADEDIVRLILDGTVVRTRIDKRAANVSVLGAIGVRRDGQKVLLSIRNMGGESTAAWSGFLGDLDKRGLKRPEFVIVAPKARVPRDGAPGLEAALARLWGEDLAVQRSTVHKHRNLLAHAPKHLHEEIGEDSLRPRMWGTRATLPALARSSRSLPHGPGEIAPLGGIHRVLTITRRFPFGSGSRSA